MRGEAGRRACGGEQHAAPMEGELRERRRRGEAVHDPAASEVPQQYLIRVRVRLGLGLGLARHGR